MINGIEHIVFSDDAENTLLREKIFALCCKKDFYFAPIEFVGKL